MSELCTYLYDLRGGEGDDNEGERETHCKRVSEAGS